jgi:hypothetical protein
MAETTKNGVRVTIEIWVDHGKIVFSNVNNDFGPKGARLLTANCQLAMGADDIEAEEDRGR